MSDWADDWKFGTILKKGFSGLTVMVICPGTEEGVLTDEGTFAGIDGYVVLTLDRGSTMPGNAYWPLHRTAVLTITQDEHWQVIS